VSDDQRAVQMQGRGGVCTDEWLGGKTATSVRERINPVRQGGGQEDMRTPTARRPHFLHLLFPESDRAEIRLAMITLTTIRQARNAIW
jgi:hypothetical protein